MFIARFLHPERNPTDETLTPRSELFSRRALVRYDALSMQRSTADNNTVSPMTMTLVAAAEARTASAVTATVNGLNLALAEPTQENDLSDSAQVATNCFVDVEAATSQEKMTPRKTARKRKEEVLDVAPRKRSRATNGGTRKRKTEPGAATVEPENSAGIPQNSNDSCGIRT